MHYQSFTVMANTKIAFLILPKIHLLDFAGPDQVFYEAIDYGADIELEYCCLNDQNETSTRFPIGRLKHYNEVKLKKGDYLLIPGSDTHHLLSEEIRSQKDLFEWLKMAHITGVNLCSICTGAYVLALAGLLDNRKCTTHWKHTAKLQTLFPETQVIENILFVEDEGITTSAGVTSGIDMALNIVSTLNGELFSYKVARELVVYSRRQGNQAQQSIYLQYRNHIHSGIHKVQDWIQENTDKKSNLADLGEIACMSTRNLTRIFKKETGISINEFTTLIRKEKLKTLLKLPDVSRKQMAIECGLKSERQIIRLIRQA